MENSNEATSKDGDKQNRDGKTIKDDEEMLKSDEKLTKTDEKMLKNDSDSHVTPRTMERDAAVAERTRSQTNKASGLEVEFDKLTLRSMTTPTALSGTDSSTVKSTPKRPNSAKTRSHRLVFQKSELDDARPKSAGVQVRTRRRKDDAFSGQQQQPASALSASAASNLAAANLASNVEADSSILQQQQQSASPSLPLPSSAGGRKKRQQPGVKNRAAIKDNNSAGTSALPGNPTRGNFKQRWGKPFKGRRRSSSTKAEEEPILTTTPTAAANASFPPASGTTTTTPTTATPASARLNHRSGADNNNNNNNNNNSGNKSRRRRRSTKSTTSDSTISETYAVGALDDILQPTVDALERHLPTGLIYDDRMLLHRDESDRFNVETPARLTAIYDKFCEYGLVDRCDTMEARPVTREEIETFHDRVLLDKMALLKDALDDDEEKKRRVMEELELTHDGVYFNDATWEAAHLAAGGCIEAVDKVVEGTWRNAFALVRPPGHHAMQSDFCGFCYFNNAVLAAKHAINNLGVEKVVIVDWDVHHGNGTQDAFYSDPRVLYFSLHRYEFGLSWPHLRESDYDYIGRGEGKGFNVNVPLNKAGCGDVDYLFVFFQILLPLLREFNPELIIVSAGFDAAIGDPLGEMRLTPSCYAQMTHCLTTFAGGKVVVLLEGGYFLPSLAESASATLKTLLGDAIPRPQISSSSASKPEPLVVDVVHNLKCVLRPHWQCFQQQRQQQQQQQQQHHSQHLRRRRRSSESTAASAAAAAAAASATPLRRSQKHDLVTFKSYHVNRPRCYSPDHYDQQSTEEIEGFREVLHASLKHHHHRRRQKHSRQSSLQNVAPFSPSSRVSGTAIVYDSAMKRHRNAVDPSHPEKPDRISSIYGELSRFGLLKHCRHVDSRLATEAELTLCHTQSHVNDMRATKTTSGRDLHRIQSALNSVYLNQSSYDCARLSCGCLLNIVDDVVNQRSRNGMAVIRPPGHHAESGGACGFCLFNNVAVAARYARVKYGERCEKILIVDWDVHHGNGTQHIFEDDPSVLYISLHRHDEGSFFPGSDDADSDRIGVGSGAGFNANIPWDTGGGKRIVGDAAYLTAFWEVVMPVAAQFDPDLVLVSAGFDAAVGDPLGKCRVTPMAFAQMTRFLCGLAEGRVILALEGGYNLKSISECMSACAAALLGCPPPRLKDANRKSSSSSASSSFFSKPPHHKDREAIEKVKDELRPFWPVLDARVVVEEPIEDEEEKWQPVEDGMEEDDDYRENKNGNKNSNNNNNSNNNSNNNNNNSNKGADRNRRLGSESEDLADVFESLTIATIPTCTSQREVEPSPAASDRTTTSAAYATTLASPAVGITAPAAAGAPATTINSAPATFAPSRPSAPLDPDLKLKMAEFDLKLAQVPAVVTPEVQEEAKHLIRVLFLGQEGALAYEDALQDAPARADDAAAAPAIPLAAPPPTLSPESAPRSPTAAPALEDSGILVVFGDEPELKMEDA